MQNKRTLVWPSSLQCRNRLLFLMAVSSFILVLPRYWRFQCSTMQKHTWSYLRPPVVLLPCLYGIFYHFVLDDSGPKADTTGVRAYTAKLCTPRHEESKSSFSVPEMSLRGLAGVLPLGVAVLSATSRVENCLRTSTLHDFKGNTH